MFVEVEDGATGARRGFRPGEVETLRALSAVFADVAAFMSAGATWSEELALPDPIAWCYVDPHLFRLLGVQPVRGRVLGELEAARYGSVALVSSRLRHAGYGGSPDVLEKRLTRDSATSYQIVGVMPRGFFFPAPPADVWVPFPPELRREDRIASIQVVARLTPHMTAVAAQAAAAAALSRLHGFEKSRVTLVPVEKVLFAAARRVAPLLIVALITVLGLATTVVWHLLLSDAVSRRFDVALSIALGASRVRASSVFLIKGVAIAAAAAWGGSLLVGVTGSLFSEGP